MRRAVVLLAALVAAGCVRAPPADLAKPKPSEREACRIAAAMLAGEEQLSRYGAQPGAAPGPSAWEMIELSVEERADLAAGGPAGPAGPLRCDWRGLGFSQAPAARSVSVGRGLICGASFSTPWIGASGRLAVMEAEEGCLADLGTSATCLLEKTQTGWVVTRRCSYGVM